jgi:hypothetical protein
MGGADRGNAGELRRRLSLRIGKCGGGRGPQFSRLWQMQDLGVLEGVEREKCKSEGQKTNGLGKSKSAEHD